MATLEQIAEAIKRADAAGNADDVMALGAAYRALQSQQAQPQQADPQALPPLDPQFRPKFAFGEDSLVPQQGPDLLTSTAATVNGLVNGIPVVGPIAQNLTDAIGGTVVGLTGGDAQQYMQHQRDLRRKTAEAAPLASMAGNITSGVGSLIATGGLSGGAEALGVTSRLANPALNLGQRVVNSGLSTLGIGTADSIARGERPTDALGENLGAAGIAATLPIVGAGARAAGRGIRDNVLRPLMTAANRENEVTRRISGAISQDTASGARMAPEMERTANQAGADVVNADRFGSAIRTLARTASNVSPEADNALRNVTEQRFLTQGNRAVNFVRQLMGGATDDLALQDSLRTAAQATNKKAYDAAFNSPRAGAVWNPQIRELMQSDTFRAAIRSAESRGTDKAAVSGFKAVRNPFTFGPNGEIGLATLPDGSRALPSLAFWDQVKRNLDSMIGNAQRSGDRALTADLTAMKQKLVGALDQQVPAYAQARRGAAGFFGAEDAIDAGRKAVKTTKATPEIERAVAAMSPAERDAFSVGFSSELIDAINATRDRVNVINSIFGSESARRRISAALGPQRARELEAFVRMEQVLDMLRTATQGNSTTAKQLIQAGLMGGGAGGLGLLASGGDITTGFSAASIAVLGRRGLQMMGKHVDDQVMRRVAEILASPDAGQLQRAIQNASLSQAHMQAIEAIMRGLGSGARGAVLGGSEQPAPQRPLEISVPY